MTLMTYVGVCASKAPSRSEIAQLSASALVEEDPGHLDMSAFLGNVRPAAAAISAKLGNSHLLNASKRSSGPSISPERLPRQ